MLLCFIPQNSQIIDISKQEINWCACPKKLQNLLIFEREEWLGSASPFTPSAPSQKYFGHFSRKHLSGHACVWHDLTVIVIMVAWTSRIVKLKPFNSTIICETSIALIKMEVPSCVKIDLTLRFYKANFHALYDYTYKWYVLFIFVSWKIAIGDMKCPLWQILCKYCWTFFFVLHPSAITGKVWLCTECDLWWWLGQLCAPLQTLAWFFSQLSSEQGLFHFLASGGHTAAPSAQSGLAEASIYSGVRCSSEPGVTWKTF